MIAHRELNRNPCAYLAEQRSRLNPHGLGVTDVMVNGGTGIERGWLKVFRVQGGAALWRTWLCMTVLLTAGTGLVLLFWAMARFW